MITLMTHVPVCPTSLAFNLPNLGCEMILLRDGHDGNWVPLWESEVGLFANRIGEFYGLGYLYRSNQRMGFETNEHNCGGPLCSI